MASAKQPLETIFADIREAGNLHRRSSLRRHADIYRRNAGTLLYWTFPASRAAVVRSVADPDNPAVTKALCRALWRDLRTAKALPRYLAGRALRLSALRMLFGSECTLYLRQRNSIGGGPDTAALTVGEWLNGVCRAVESGATARVVRNIPPRANRRPRGPESLAAADRHPPAAFGQSAGSYPGPSSGHRK